MSASPRIFGMLETGVCVSDLARSSAFYRMTLGLDLLVASERLHAFAVAPGETLILFDRALAQHDVRSAAGFVPGHGTHGRAHFCFRIRTEDHEAWVRRLADAGVAIIGQMNWPAGGRSLYFNDPEGNVLELATPGLWANYPKDFSETQASEANQ